MIEDLKAQLAQVQERIADCLEARKWVRNQGNYRINEARLHNLYVLQAEIQRDLAREMA